MSILGHPLLMLPAALALPVALHDGDPRTLRTMLVAFALFAALMFGWSRLRLRLAPFAKLGADFARRRLGLPVRAA